MAHRPRRPLRAEQDGSRHARRARALGARPMVGAPGRRRPAGAGFPPDPRPLAPGPRAPRPACRDGAGRLPTASDRRCYETGGARVNPTLVTENPSHGTARREGRHHHGSVQGHRTRPQPVLRPRGRGRDLRGALGGARPRDRRAGPAGGRPRARRDLRRLEGGRRRAHGRRGGPGVREAHDADQQRGRRRSDPAGRGVHDGRLALHDPLLPDQLVRVHPLRRAGDGQGRRRRDRQRVLVRRAGAGCPIASATARRRPARSG